MKNSSQITAPRAPALVAFTEYAQASGSLSERVYFLIRDQIISLALKLGTMIEESRLMSQLGIGRTPIREALNA